MSTRLGRRAFAAACASFWLTPPAGAQSDLLKIGAPRGTIDFAIGISALPVKPLGSKRTCANLFTRSRSGTPYCNATLTVVAKVSTRPLTVEPSFAIFRKISPGWPSS